MMYAFHIALPLAALLCVPLSSSYIDNIVLTMLSSGEMSIYEADMMQRLMDFLLISISVLYAVTFACALIPNTIYFNKRKDLLE